MATVTKPLALNESFKTTEQNSRNVADVLAQELSGIASAITGGADKVPKTDIATVEPTNTASRAYSVGELVYVNGNLYKVITAISIGATFTVGTNIQSTNVSSNVSQISSDLTSLIGNKLSFGAITDLSTNDVFTAVENNWANMGTGTYTIRTSVYTYFVIVFKADASYGSVICMGYRGVLLAFRSLWAGAWQSIQYLAQ